MLNSVNTDEWSKANGHADEIEYAWDAAESRLRPLNADARTMSTTRSTHRHPNPGATWVSTASSTCAL
jgi:hypothetical protein